MTRENYFNQCLFFCYTISVGGVLTNQTRLHLFAPPHINMIKIGIKMEWIIGIVAFIVGAGGGTGITYSLMKNKPVQVVETNKVVEKMVEVDLSLTETDLLKIPCSAEYIEKNGESLCREMFCRMNTRSGNQANAASSKECESISNLINTKVIIETCDNDIVEENNLLRDHCERLFEKRK